MKITQYNKLIVNYDTYEFTPSNYSQIVINDPWYIDTSSAPDFIETIKEINNYNDLITIPEDVYTYEAISFKVTGTFGSKNISVNKISNKTHTEILNTIHNTTGGTLKFSDYYAYYTYRNNYEYYTSNASVMTTKQQILFPIINIYGYVSNQPIPLIKTITITINSSNFHMYIPADTITKSQNGTSTVKIIAGDYTYKQYIDTILNNINISKMNYIDKYNYIGITRIQNPICRISGSGFNKLNGIFHCFNNLNINHNIFTPANSRCLYLPPKQYTVDELITAVNSNSSNVLFTLSSSKDYIYINCDMPFIINPICSIVTEDTDTSANFKTQHILLKRPSSYRNFTAKCTYKSKTYTQNGSFTPAEFLRWIYSVTGVKCNIHNNIIQCLDYDLTVDENPFFEFKEFGIVENKCGLRTINYKIDLDNGCKLININYYPSLTTYDYQHVQPISNNMITTLNTIKVKQI